MPLDGSYSLHMHASVENVQIQANLQARLNKSCLRPVWRSETHMRPAMLPALLKDIVKVLHALMLLKVTQHLFRGKVQWARCSRNVKSRSCSNPAAYGIDFTHQARGVSPHQL